MSDATHRQLLGAVSLQPGCAQVLQLMQKADLVFDLILFRHTMQCNTLLIVRSIQQCLNFLQGGGGEVRKWDFVVLLVSVFVVHARACVCSCPSLQITLAEKVWIACISAAVAILLHVNLV